MEIKEVLNSRVVKVVVGTAIGAIVTWVLVNWLQTLVVLAGAGLVGYIVYEKTK